MKVYLRGVLLRTKNANRIMQIVDVEQDGTDVWYHLKPIRRGPEVRISHRTVNHYYVPVGIGVVHPVPAPDLEVVDESEDVNESVL